MSGHHSKRHANRGPSASLMGSKTVNSEIERIRQSEVAYKAKIRAVSGQSTVGGAWGRGSGAEGGQSGGRESGCVQGGQVGMSKQGQVAVSKWVCTGKREGGVPM